MSFEVLRRHCQQSTVFSTDYFGEVVRLEEPGKAEVELTVNCQQSAKLTNRQYGGAKPSAKADVDSSERLRVVISHDETFAGGFLADAPQVGSLLYRGEERDTDVRPWIYTGEVAERNWDHGVYIFARSKRACDGRRTT